MFKHSIFATFSILFLVGLVFPVQAGTEPSCLEKASRKIKPNSKITLIKTDQSKISGRLVSIDLVRLSLSVIPIIGDTIMGSQSNYEISEIDKIQYRGYGKMKLGVILPFTVLGAVAGGVIGNTKDPFCEAFQPLDPNSECKTYVAEFAAIGGVSGFVIGTLVSLFTMSSFSIECE